jgi:hypothetical protein
MSERQENPDPPFEVTRSSSGGQSDRQEMPHLSWTPKVRECSHRRPLLDCEYNAHAQFL